MPGDSANDDSRTLTQHDLVDTLRRAGALNDVRVDSAFSTVPRHAFLPDFPANRVYTDQSIPVRTNYAGDATVAATMPSMVARLLTQAELQEGHNVLHIGTGVGFSAALVSHIVGDYGNVTSLEYERDMANIAQERLIRNGYSHVKVVNVDGAEGYAPRAAYDRIVATVGLWDIPAAWIRQIKADGVIAAPVWVDGLQVIAAFRVQPDGTLLAEGAMPSAFVYIQGQAAMPQVRKRVGSTALQMISDEIHRVDSAALHLLLSQDHDADNYLTQRLDTTEYWYGFLPYLAINEPEQGVFAVYTIDPDRKAYGMEGEGFALLTPASACFVPYEGAGGTNCFAGADAFMEVEAQVNQWIDIGRPGIDRLRMRFIPRAHGIDPHVNGKVYPRRDHFLHLWYVLDEMREEASGAAAAQG